MENKTISMVERAIQDGILAKPKHGNIELQSRILRVKGFEGISYVAYSGKVVSVLEDGTVRVYSPARQLMEEYPKLLGGEEQ